MNALRTLHSRLKAGPVTGHRFTPQRAVEAWSELRQLDGSELTPALMAALLLAEDEFAALLEDEERKQLADLASRALRKFNELTRPPNQIGKTMLAAIQDATAI